MLWLTEPTHVHLSNVGVALCVSSAIAAYLLAVGFIEWVSGDPEHRVHLLTKVFCATAVLGVALAAPILGVPGAVLCAGLLLAALAAYGVFQQHRLHRQARHVRPGR